MPDSKITINTSDSLLSGYVPAVSIGMPVYNGEKFIREALDSLLAQTFSDFELIISDNASTDNTEKICQEYLSRDSRIKYIRQDFNKGPGANFRFVLEKSVGTFFMWAACDDTWESNWLEILISELKKDDIAIRGLAKITNPAGILLGSLPVKNFQKMEIFRVFLDNEKNGKVFHIYGLFWKNKLLSVPFDVVESDMYAADVIFIFQLIQYGNLRCVSKTAQFYRRHDMGTGALQTKKQNNLRRIVCCAYDLDFYKYHIKAAPEKYQSIMLLLSLVKMMKTQIELWSRGFIYLVCHRRKL